MFRIRKITNPFLEGNKKTVERIKEIIRLQFPALHSNELENISEQMVNQLKKKYQTL